MKMRLSQTLVAALSAVVVVSGCGGAGETADALDDRLTEAFDFDIGMVVEGEPPAGQEGELAPQIAILSAPDQVMMGKPFIVALTADPSLSDTVDKAIIHVGAAPERHIIVSRGLVKSGGIWRMDLAGIIRPDNVLLGKSFSVYVALQSRTGLTGSYRVWELQIADQIVNAPGGRYLEEIEVKGESWHPSGRPHGSSESGAPQISAVTAPAVVYVGEPFALTLTSDNTTDGGRVASVLASTIGNIGYKKTETFVVREAQDLSASILVDVEVTILDEGLRGIELLLLLALQDDQGGTGWYHPVPMTVADAIAPPPALIDDEAFLIEFDHSTGSINSLVWKGKGALSRNIIDESWSRYHNSSPISLSNAEFKERRDGGTAVAAFELEAGRMTITYINKAYGTKRVDMLWTANGLSIGVAFEPSDETVAFGTGTTYEGLPARCVGKDAAGEHQATYTYPGGYADLLKLAEAEWLYSATGDGQAAWGYSSGSYPALAMTAGNGAAADGPLIRGMKGSGTFRFCFTSEAAIRECFRHASEASVAGE